MNDAKIEENIKVKTQDLENLVKKVRSLPKFNSIPESQKFKIRSTCIHLNSRLSYEKDEARGLIGSNPLFRYDYRR